MNIKQKKKKSKRRKRKVLTEKSLYKRLSTNADIVATT